jgi:hypothetical protein
MLDTLKDLFWPILIIVVLVVGLFGLGYAVNYDIESKQYNVVSDTVYGSRHEKLLMEKLNYIIKELEAIKKQRNR